MNKNSYTTDKKGIKQLFEWLDISLEQTTQFIVKKIHDITPRDLNRPPKDPSAHVTWSLKSSIWYQRVKQLNYKAWSKQWSKNTKTWDEVSTYWEKLEFWTKHITKKSFIRKWINDNIDNIKLIFIQLAKKYLK